MLSAETGALAETPLWRQPVPLAVVAVVALPHVHMPQEFEALSRRAAGRLLWAQTPHALAPADLVVLPSSHALHADLQWLRASGMDAALADHARSGKLLLGLGTAVAMLGEAVIDSEAIDGNVPGLGLLPLVSWLAAASVRTSLHAQQLQWPMLRAPWPETPQGALHVQASVLGVCQLRADMQAQGQPAAQALVPGCWQSGAGNVWACNWHGMLADPQLWARWWPLPEGR